MIIITGESRLMLKQIITFLKKFSGDGAALPLRHGLQAVALAALGGFVTVSVLALLTDHLSLALILGSFGASCVLVFGYPDAPFSQPRNIVAGHLVSSLIGIAFLSLLGLQWWSMALAVGAAIAVMMLARIVHPPAGSNPVIVFLIKPAWSFLWFPTLSGAFLLVAVALIYNNATRPGKYPRYW